VSDAHSSAIKEFFHSSWGKKRLLMFAVSIEVSQVDATSSNDYILCEDCRSSKTSAVGRWIDRLSTVLDKEIHKQPSGGDFLCGSDAVQNEGQLGAAKSL
jgi:hypothetical protein